MFGVWCLVFGVSVGRDLIRLRSGSLAGIRHIRSQRSKSQEEHSWHERATRGPKTSFSVHSGVLTVECVESKDLVRRESWPERILVNYPPHYAVLEVRRRFRSSGIFRRKKPKTNTNLHVTKSASPCTYKFFGPRKQTREDKLCRSHVVKIKRGNLFRTFSRLAVRFGGGAARRFCVWRVPDTRPKERVGYLLLFAREIQLLGLQVGVQLLSQPEVRYKVNYAVKRPHLAAAPS